MSNLIKASSISYREEKRIVDISKKEGELNESASVPERENNEVFVSGLTAIQLNPTDETAVAMDGDPEEEMPELESKEERQRKAEQKRRELLSLKYELTKAEKMALRIEMEKDVRTQADIILEQARAEGEQLKLRAKLNAEAEKLSVLEQAQKEGYAKGQSELMEAELALKRSYKEKEQAMTERYENEIKELTPKVTEVIINLISGLTDVLLQEKRQIITYLVKRALAGYERGNSFLIKVSKEDYEEVKESGEALKGLFDREVSLEVIKDPLLKQGECLIETEYGIIDCGLQTQLSGLIEDLKMLQK